MKPSQTPNPAESASLGMALPYIGRHVTLTIDRPYGTTHPIHGFRYEANYGYVPGTLAPDGEELDAYLLGPTQPLDHAEGTCVGVIHRLDDDDDKLVVVPDGYHLTDNEILAAVAFQEPPGRHRLFRCHPETAWMIGDNPEADIVGATRCGIPGVLVRQRLPGLDCAQDSMAAVDLIEQREAERLGGIDQEMVHYYAARADQYDDWYLRRGRYSHGASDDGAWKADLDAAAAWLDARPFDGRIAEIAAGTGWWSPSLARKGELTLYDAAPEPLAKAATRLAEAGLRAQIHVRDAWAEPDRMVDGLFAGFWLSHIDRARLDQFLGLVGRWLAPGGLFAFIDSRQDPESGAVDHRPPEADIQVRKLDDGTSFCVRKVFYEPADLAAALARAGFADIEVATTDRFFVLGSARRREAR